MDWAKTAVPIKLWTFTIFWQAPARVGSKSSRSEKNMLSLLSEKWKVNFLAFTLFRKVKSEMKVTQDREVKFFENFSGVLGNRELRWILVSKISPKCDLKKCKVDFALATSHFDDARWCLWGWVIEWTRFHFFSGEMGLKNTHRLTFSGSEICKNS